MNLFILESTCDETAAAIVNEKLEVLSSVVASQEQLHQQFGGVVPEIASRAHVERILPVMHQTLEEAGLKLQDLAAVAVANTPGLAGSLLVGVSAAKALAVALKIPLIAVDHLQAHIYACQFGKQERIYPCVGFIVSGGHTNLYRCHDETRFEFLGSTTDDAAGEAFDKVASMLGLPYPGGPSIQQTAEQGNPKAYQFPRSFIHEKQRLEFSFSGLKTAVRYQISRDRPPHEAIQDCSPEKIADLAASFQQAVIDVLIAKTLQALKVTKLKQLCVGGGVAANRPFREQLTSACEKNEITVHFAPRELCTDNAVMGAIAFKQWQAGNVASLDLDVFPGLVRNS